jgi:hypothetical protein
MILQVCRWLPAAKDQRYQALIFVGDGAFSSIDFLHAVLSTDPQLSREQILIFFVRRCLGLRLSPVADVEKIPRPMWVSLVQTLAYAA